MSSGTPRFADLVEMIDRLPLDQRQSLVQIVQRRNIEQQRRQLAASVRSARREFCQGKAKPASVEDLMTEILG